MDNFNMSKDEAEWVEFGQSLQQVTATRNTNTNTNTSTVQMPIVDRKANTSLQREVI